MGSVAETVADTTGSANINVNDITVGASQIFRPDYDLIALTDIKYVKVITFWFCLIFKRKNVNVILINVAVLLYLSDGGAEEVHGDTTAGRVPLRLILRW